VLPPYLTSFSNFNKEKPPIMAKCRLFGLISSKGGSILANSLEIARDIVVAAIQHGLIQRPNSRDKDIEETNEATAESLGKLFDTVFNSVNDTLTQQ
jgi:hypothetical protein